jgi:hypothetical protein
VTGVAQGPITITATLGAINGSAALTGGPSSFRLTGSLNTPRVYFTATLLQNGQVLIVGGAQGGGSPFGTCELFNPVTGTFTLTGNLNVPREWHSATLLNNGMVLIAGGQGASGSLSSSELYDPTTGTFNLTGSLNIAREFQTATLLQNGQVLIVGGSGDSTAELYDPTAGTFTYTGSLNITLTSQTATLLNDGTVLIAGGDTYGGYTPTAKAELYNPTAGTFTTTGSLHAAREDHTATLLTTGKVLIATGAGTQGYLATTELYDPTAKTFSLSGSLAYPRAFATATELNGGQVLVVGGVSNVENAPDIDPAELYDPTSATFSIAGNLNIARDSHLGTLLNDGTVLIAGGEDPYFYEWGYFEDIIPQAEIYQTPGQPVEPPDSLQITPAVANVMVGATQHFTAIDSNGNPRQDVTWTVSNPSLASVMTDENDAAVLTGLAAGQVTLTANAETASGQEQVTILTAAAYSPGTVIWSTSPVAGFSPTQIVQAVPTASGPDLYSTQLSSDGTQSIVQALTADGRQLWQATLPALNNNTVPDGAGGLIVTEYDTCTPGQTNPLTVMGLDPVYGQPTFAIQAAGIQQGNGVVYCYGNGYDAPQIAVRGDGAVIISEPTNNGFPPLTILQAGGEAMYSIPPSSNTTNGNTIYPQCCMGPPMVNTDGNAYVEYEVRNVVNNVITSDTLYLWQLNPTTNNWSTSVLASTTQNEALLPGSIVPDGQGGILATWTISPSHPPVPQYPYQAVDVAGGAVGTPYNLPFSPTTVSFGQSPTIVLGESGVAFATDGTNTTNGPQIVSFSPISGTVNWTYQVSTQYTLSLISSVSGGGLVAKTTDQNGNDTVIRLSSTGTVTTDSWNGGQVAYYVGDLWTGIASNNTFLAYSAPPIEFSSSPWFQPQGGGQGNKGAIPALNVTGFSTTGANQTTTLNAINKLLTALALPANSSCANWLVGQNGGATGSSYLQSMIQNTAFGHGAFNITTWAFTGLGGTTGVPDGIAMVTNDNSGFYNATAANGAPFIWGPSRFIYTEWANIANIPILNPPMYTGGTLKAQVATLIHETAHGIQVEFFQNDYGVPKAGDYNNQFLYQNCHSLIDGVQ